MSKSTKKAIRKSTKPTAKKSTAARQPRKKAGPSKASAVRVKSQSPKPAKFSLATLKLTKLSKLLLLTAVILVLGYLPLLKRMHAYRVPKPAPVERATQEAYLPVGKLTDKELAQQLADTRSENPRQYAEPSIGIYENTKVIGASEPYVRHSFVAMSDTRVLSEELLKTKRLQAIPLITVEPHDGHSPRLITGPQDRIAGRQLLDDITQGKYDNQITNLAAILHNYHAPIYVRFAHEMDLANTYPWGAQDPEAYVAAYRHVILKAKEAGLPNVKWLWTPSGNTVAQDYYPGDDVVDVVGVTVLYVKAWLSGRQLSFWQLTQNQRKLSIYHKPLWIVEFGVENADRDFQKKLIKDAVDNYQAYGFSALVYINIGETNPAFSSLDYRLENRHDFSPIFY